MTPTIPELIKFLKEEIEEKYKDMKETKRIQGKHFDPNCYGAGYDEGELNSLKMVLAWIGGE